MTIIRWTPPRQSPLAELARIGRDLDRVARAAFGPSAPRAEGVFPALNLSEDAENIYVRAELPGVSAEALDLSLEGEKLTIRGERKPTDLGRDASVHRREREFGFFRRILTLPTAVDAERVGAVTDNGILTITLPKAVEAKPRQITVKSS